VSPNELSFASVKAITDIHGFPAPGKAPFVKSEFYAMYGSGFDSWCIGSERNPVRHREMKSSLSAAFSTKALHEQEAIVVNVIDSFVSKLSQVSEAPGSSINLCKWYEMVAFDLMGEMAFGESFNCIETGQYFDVVFFETRRVTFPGKPHFWTELILGHLFFITVADNLRHIPLVPTIARALVPALSSLRKDHMQYTRDKVTR
jgi:hypothetical protein